MEIKLTASKSTAEGECSINKWSPPACPLWAVFEHSKPDEKGPQWCWGKCCFRTSLIPCSTLSSCQMPCCQVWRGQGFKAPSGGSAEWPDMSIHHMALSGSWHYCLLSRGALWLIGWMNVDERSFDNICTGNNSLSYGQCVDCFKTTQGSKKRWTGDRYCQSMSVFCKTGTKCKCSTFLIAKWQLKANWLMH